MNIVFRADSGLSVGSGHLVRCLTLAQRFKARGATIRFIGRDLPGAQHALVEQAGFGFDLLSQEQGDAEACGALLANDRIDVLIVDNYALDADWEQRFRGRVGCLAVIDDMANRRHDCDVLIDQNFHVDAAARYAGLLPDDAQTLFGPHYALLRPEFAAARATTAPRQGKLERVVVFYTGGDDQGETMKALAGLAAWRSSFATASLAVDTVVGAAHPQRSDVEEFCRRYGWRCHCQIDYMARLMAQADLVLGAGSSASWERCAVGAPALVTILSDNQAELTAALAEQGAIRSLGWAHTLRSDDYAEALAALNEQALTAMSERAWSLVDGNGSERVCQALTDRLNLSSLSLAGEEGAFAAPTKAAKNTETGV
ncbi:UDP-2,4-diacetamido-2,4,6-trideoxy-beta-L-altropyranose hydrolase [Andreprevotia chitinilytica]|uniref:UDP-2,4-diacetamido-2,4, 6-trideoxy-beta-L-altropyranose hydrolase n=1 Tax=Andreprevotia chitinilytica TaxID=396808 RepID=UPI00068B1BD8|nr:UDP-2,4-diacetamido-2,4,6-trideoxy-beta-L-altropyranose hydrolase [Andreprevotia chitinilytica]